MTHATIQNNFQNKQSTKLNKNKKLLHFIIIFILFNVLSQSIFAKRIKTPQPWQAQAGQVQILRNSGDRYPGFGDYRFLATFSITLRILIIIPQTYQIVLGYRAMDVCFTAVSQPNPSMQIGPTNPTGDSSASSTFQINLYLNDQTMLASIKVNYLLLGNQLVSKSLMMGQLMQIKSPDLACNARAAPLTCGYVKNLPFSLPNINYKIYLSISGLRLRSDSSIVISYPVVWLNVTYILYSTIPTATPSRIQLTYVSFTLSTINLQLSLQKVDLDSLSFYLIAINPTMFINDIFRGTTLLQYLPSSITAASAFQQLFPESILQTNFFIGVTKYKGVKWEYFLSQFTPSNNKLKGQLLSSGTLLRFFGLVMYGYTDSCKIHRNCLACYVYPNYDCIECQKNFILTNPPNTNTSCKCPSQFKLVSGVCDIIPFGCIVAQRLSDNSIICHMCDFSKHLILNTTNHVCQCNSKYQMDNNNVCQDLCGDGIRITLSCDDGNKLIGDGCSSTCSLQPGFTCDTTLQPTKCKSSTKLLYAINQINKNQKLNSAIIKLNLRNIQVYTFPVLKQQFQPTPSFVNFKIILSHNPYQELIINDFQMINIDSENHITLSFNYNMSIQNTNAQILLNYAQTNYYNYTQVLQFSLKGTNQPLKYDNQMESYKNIGIIMMIGTILNALMLFIGFITSKFIGIQSILTLQLIFFSQILIYDNGKFPIGFVFLQNFQYTAGFNNIFDFTDYTPFTDTTKKMHHIKRQKLIIQNFNINFIILIVSFILLTVSLLIRRNNQKKVEQCKKIRKTIRDRNFERNSSQSIQIPLLRVLNDRIFYISNQIAFWLFLPLISSISASILIQNFTLTKRPIDHGSFFQTVAGQLICVLAFLIIFGIILSNFSNIWQSNRSMYLVYERPQQIQYKRWLFIYLNIIGTLIFFMNQLFLLKKIYCSAIVLGIQLVHLIVVIIINPYKQSLKIHTVGMILNNLFYLVFLVVINFINYLNQIDQTITLFLGYGITGTTGILIILTIIRLYYELRYGRQLEDKMQEERLKRQQQQKERRDQQLKKRINQMENQAKKKISERQKIRQRNVYLHQNQVKQEQKKQLIEWLQNRNLIDQKMKQTKYFDKFADKPLDWLKINDKQKYNKKIDEINEFSMKDKIKIGGEQSERFMKITQKLRKQVKSMKKQNNLSLRKHALKMRSDGAYAMNIMKFNKDRYMNSGYELKQ